jgi:hypothetical protein
VKALLDNFAAIFGTATVVMLVMSVTHEYGYFWSIGLQFQTFLTTTDYLANGVLWLPFALVFMYGTIQWKDIRRDLPEKTNLPKWQKRVSNGILVAFALFILSIATWPMNLLAGLWFIVLGGLAWAWLTRRRFSLSVTLDDPLQLIARQAIRFGPPVILAIFLLGSVNADRDLNGTDDPYVFQFKNDDSPKQRIFLRNFDKGVLVRDATERTIEFYKWDEITKISRAAPNPSLPFLCRRFGMMCEITTIFKL